MILIRSPHASLFIFGFLPSVLFIYLMIWPTINLGGMLLHIKMTRRVRGSENLESPIFYTI